MHQFAFLRSLNAISVLGKFLLNFPKFPSSWFLLHFSTKATVDSARMHITNAIKIPSHFDSRILSVPSFDIKISSFSRDWRLS
jgi:hypothetical protein